MKWNIENIVYHSRVATFISRFSSLVPFFFLIIITLIATTTAMTTMQPITIPAIAPEDNLLLSTH